MAPRLRLDVPRRGTVPLAGNFSTGLHETQMRIRKRHLAWLVLGLLLVPFPVPVAPEWGITVVDLAGKPVAGITARQYWLHHTFEGLSADHHEETTTDQNGKVVFKKRVIWSNALMALVGGLANRLLFGVHADFGPVAGIMARRGCEIGHMVYVPGTRLKPILILDDRMATPECR